MNVRTRLTIGLTALVGALLGLGALSGSQLWRMSALTQRIIAANYDSVVAAQQMKESLERQDSAGLFALLGRSDLAARQLREHRARFDDACRHDSVVDGVPRGRHVPVHWVAWLRDTR